MIPQYVTISTTYRLAQDPWITESGEFYCALCVDDAGGERLLFWRIIDPNLPRDQACDWEKPGAIDY